MHQPIAITDNESPIAGALNQVLNRKFHLVAKRNFLDGGAHYTVAPNSAVEVPAMNLSSEARYLTDLLVGDICCELTRIGAALPEERVMPYQALQKETDFPKDIDPGIMMAHIALSEENHGLTPNRLIRIAPNDKIAHALILKDGEKGRQNSRFVESIDGPFCAAYQAGLSQADLRATHFTKGAYYQIDIAGFEQVRYVIKLPSVTDNPYRNGDIALSGLENVVRRGPLALASVQELAALRTAIGSHDGHFNHPSYTRTGAVYFIRNGKLFIAIDDIIDPSQNAVIAKLEDIKRHSGNRDLPIYDRNDPIIEGHIARARKSGRIIEFGSHVYKMKTSSFKNGRSTLETDKLGRALYGKLVSTSPFKELGLPAYIFLKNPPTLRKYLNDGNAMLMPMRYGHYSGNECPIGTHVVHADDTYVSGDVRFVRDSPGFLPAKRV